jgi:hypothetical protein
VPAALRLNPCPAPSTDSSSAHFITPPSRHPEPNCPSRALTYALPSTNPGLLSRPLPVDSVPGPACDHETCCSDPGALTAASSPRSKAYALARLGYRLIFSAGHEVSSGPSIAGKSAVPLVISPICTFPLLLMLSSRVATACPHSPLHRGHGDVPA